MSDRPTVRRTDKQTDKSTKRQRYTQTDGWTDGATKGGTDNQTNAHMEEGQIDIRTGISGHYCDYYSIKGIHS